jgi:molybdenum cofactor biosynthesis enzyme MoaA
MIIYKKNISNKDVYYNREFDIISINDCRLDNLNYYRTDKKEIFDIVFEINNSCNQECKNCFCEYTYDSKRKVELPCSFIDSIITKENKNVVRISITGGEPFLHSEIIQILNLPKKYSDMNYVISTNGSINDENINEMLINQDWLLCISLHGGESHHNKYTNSVNFYKTMSFLKRMAGLLRIHLYCVLDENQTEEDFTFLFELREKYHLCFIRFIVPRMFGRWKEVPLDTIKLCESFIDEKSGIKRLNSYSTFFSVDGKERDSK